MAKHTVVIVSTRRVRDWAVATIPVPESTYHLETVVQCGGRYVVTTYERGDMSVWPMYLQRRRPMRSCPRRDAITSAVRAALP